MAINVGGQPNLRRMFQRSRLTLSNAFVRSTKAMYNKYHVNCVASPLELALRLRQDKINNMLEKTGEYDFSQHFACNREKGNATTVATFCSVTLLLVYKNSVGIFSLLWETLNGPAVKDKIMQPSV